MRRTQFWPLRYMIYHMISRNYSIPFHTFLRVSIFRTNEFFLIYKKTWINKWFVSYQSKDSVLAMLKFQITHVMNILDHNHNCWVNNVTVLKLSLSTIINACYSSWDDLYTASLVSNVSISFHSLGCGQLLLTHTLQFKNDN